MSLLMMVQTLAKRHEGMGTARSHDATERRRGPRLAWPHNGALCVWDDVKDGEGPPRATPLLRPLSRHPRLLLSWPLFGLRGACLLPGSPLSLWGGDESRRDRPTRGCETTACVVTCRKKKKGGGRPLVSTLTAVLGVM